MKNYGAIIGRTGLLGQSLYSVLASDWELLQTYYSNARPGLIALDITKQDQVNDFFIKYKPQVCFICAAIANPDICEDNNELAWTINVEGCKNVIEAALGVACKPVFFSTDYVFDGSSPPYSESDDVCPINYYGFTKVKAEEIILQNAPNALIVRLPILYGKVDYHIRPLFLYQMMVSLRSDSAMPLDNWQIRFPTDVNYVAQAVQLLLMKRISGLVHISAGEPMTKYIWCCIIAEKLKLDKHLLVSTNLIASKASRPYNCALKTDKLDEIIGETLTCKRVRDSVLELFSWQR